MDEDACDDLSLQFGQSGDLSQNVQGCTVPVDPVDGVGLNAVVVQVVGVQFAAATPSEVAGAGKVDGFAFRGGNQKRFGIADDGRLVHQEREDGLHDGIFGEIGTARGEKDAGGDFLHGVAVVQVQFGPVGWVCHRRMTARLGARTCQRNLLAELRPFRSRLRRFAVQFRSRD